MISGWVPNKIHMQVISAVIKCKMINYVLKNMLVLFLSFKNMDGYLVTFVTFRNSICNDSILGHICRPFLVPSSAKRIATENCRENCSRLRMKTLERCQRCHSSVYMVNCQHISNFLLIIDFEQAKVCWVHIEKINTFEDKIRYIIRYVVVI